MADAPADEPVMLVESAGDLVASLADGATPGHELGDFVPLGVVLTESETWLGRPDLDLRSDTDTPLVASVSAVEANIGLIGLAALSMGHQVRLVSGYSGSGDALAAVLRGETEFSSKSLVTARRALEGGDLAVALVLSDGPDPALPDAPFLAGEGGLAWERSAGLPDAERDERQRLARLAVELSSGARLIFASTRLPAEVQACLVEVTEAALSDPAFGTAAEAQGRPVTPGTAAEAADLLARKAGVQAEVAPLMERITTAVRP